MRYLFSAAALIVLAGLCCADDDFLGRVRQLDALTKRKADCACSSQADCICAPGTCKCPACLLKAKPVILGTAPKSDYRHDCGCPSSAPCNCGGNCHCAEGRAENRLPMRWRQEDGGAWWSLWRGQRQLGATDSDGNYRPLHEDGTFGAPCKLPASVSMPLPIQRTMIALPASGRSC